MNVISGTGSSGSYWMKAC